MRKIWIDSDCASDDAMAIMMAIFQPEIDVLGISIVSGYRPASQVWKNPFIICSQAGVPALPVAMGSDVPFGFRYMLPEVHVHGEDGLGDLQLPFPAYSKLMDKHSVWAIIEAVNKYPDEIEIVTLGPLTNLALALRIDPTIAKRIKKLWIMGGTGKSPGNISAVAEANIGGDPEASQVVLTSGIDIILITLDAADKDMFYSLSDQVNLL